MNKLKYKLGYTKLLLYVFALIASLYVIYIFVTNLRDTTKEGLFNAKTLTTQLLCRSDRCMEGCKAPTKITEQCGKSIYRDMKNKCYRLCPYTCDGENDPCIANDCCVGCKQKKFEVPCENLIPKGAVAGLSTDASLMPFFATGYTDIEDDPRATEKAIEIYRMMKDVSTVYDKYSGEILNKKEYECSPNITSTFTECGPPPASLTDYE